MKDEKMELLAWKKIQSGAPVEAIVEAIQEQYSVPKDMASKRLENLFLILDAMDYDLNQLIWDVQKAGKVRELFEDTMAFEFSK